MYYLAKTLQALGLLVILIEFLRNFPDLMEYRSLAAGLLLFGIGWVVTRFILKKQ